MPNHERGYHSLSKLQNSTVPGLSLDLDLPYVDRDKIGVNPRRIEWYKQVSGLRSVHIVGVDGPTSGHKVDDSGVIFEKLEPVTQVKITDVEDPAHLHAARRIDTEIQVNVNEILTRMQYANEQLRDPEAWSDRLSQAITHGLTRIGAYHLSQEGMGWQTYASGMVSGVSIAELPTRQAIPTILALNLGANLLTRFAKRQEIQPDTYRWSLFFGAQFDRAAVLKTMEKTVRVAKALR